MDNFERTLCQRIMKRINLRGYCVIYDNELSRLCAPEKALREKQIRTIEKFAAKHGLAVRVREIGLNATFRERAVEGAPGNLKGKNGSGSKPRLQVGTGRANNERAPQASKPAKRAGVIDGYLRT